MKKIKNSFLISLSLILFSNSLPIYANTNVFVAENTKSDKEVIEGRKSDLDFLISTLEQKHSNIYSVNDKSVFNSKVEEIKSKLESMSDIDFAIYVSELVALGCDSHTKAIIGNIFENVVHYFPMSYIPVKEGLMITATSDKNTDMLGGILVSINNIPLDEIKNKLKPMISYDNDVYLQREFYNNFKIYEFLNHYGILDSPNNIPLGVNINGELKTVYIDALDENQLANVNVVRLERNLPPTEVDRSKLYFSKPLDENTLYIQYNSCREDKNLPMQDFANQVKADIEQNKYDRVVIDLRNNTGGSDGVIRPLMNILEEKHKKYGLELYTLVGMNTFSSALINSVMLKQIGSVIVGTPTGGSVDHFGSISSFELPYSKIGISYSNKFIDVATLLDVAKPYGIEPFQPDIYVEQTASDYLVGKDTAVEHILKIPINNEGFESKFTRADLSVEIFRDYFNITNESIKSVDNIFNDVSRISYVIPYISWAVDKGIMFGVDENMFLPDKDLTKAELSEVLFRYSKLIGLNIPSSNIVINDIETVPDWAKNSVMAFAGSGIFNINNGNFEPNSIVSNGDFNTIFSNFKKLYN